MNIEENIKKKQRKNREKMEKIVQELTDLETCLMSELSQNRLHPTCLEQIHALGKEYVSLCEVNLTLTEVALGIPDVEEEDKKKGGRL